MRSSRRLGGALARTENVRPVAALGTILLAEAAGGRSRSPGAGISSAWRRAGQLAALADGTGFPGHCTHVARRQLHRALKHSRVSLAARKACVVTTNSLRSSNSIILPAPEGVAAGARPGALWTVTREGSSLTGRVGAAELAHGPVELLGPLELADMPRAGNHYKRRVWDGPLKLVGDVER